MGFQLLQNHQKRGRPDDSTSDAHEARTKRLKTTPSYYPARFWDTLSTVRLSRRALKELDRRAEEGNDGQELGRVATQTAGSWRILRSDARRLRQIASKGGPDLSTLRGHSYVPSVTMSQSSNQSRKRSYASSSRSSSVAKTATTTPYSAEFEQKMIDRGVFPNGYRQADGGRHPKPSNFEELQRMLSCSRPSLSPSAFSEGAFEDFQDKNEQARSESKAMASVIPIVAGSQDARHHSSGDVPFYSLQKFDPDISSAKPDTYYGARPAQIDPRVRRELGEYIVPSSQRTRPAAPNFFLEAKGDEGKPNVARRQAMYDAALGARGMLHLQNYGNAATVYDGNAYSLAATYSDGTLKMYATHPSESSQPEQTEYHMTQLDSFAMTGNVNGFRSGAAAYRNARDWTEEQRNRFIANANTAAQNMSTETASSRIESAGSSRTAIQESTCSETSEDAAALEAPARRKQRRG